MQGYARPVVLILGGSGKGEDYAPLRAAMDPVRHVILLGEEGPVIGAALDGHVAMSRAGSMDEAVRCAAEIAAELVAEIPEGKTIAPEVDILLSPACASFDLFTNYHQRGEAFTAAALKLGAERVS